MKKICLELEWKQYPICIYNEDDIVEYVVDRLQ